MTTTSRDNHDLPFAEWDSFPDKAYERALTEVKEQFNDLLSEIESTTSKLYKLLAIFVPFLSAATSVIASRGYSSCIVMILGAASIYNVCGIFWLLRGRESFSRGLGIEAMTNGAFDRDDFEEEDKVKLLYVNCIEAYTRKIALIRLQVISRNEYYNLHLAITISIAVAVSAYAGWLFSTSG